MRTGIYGICAFRWIVTLKGRPDIKPSGVERGAVAKAADKRRSAAAR